MNKQTTFLEEHTEWTIIEYAQAVGDAMANFSYAPIACTNGYADLVHRDGSGRGFTIRTDGWTGHKVGEGDRIVVHCNWPEAVGANHFYPRARYGEPEPKFSITCAAKRGPAAVARDIERRLLPDYLAKYAEMAEERERTLAGTAEKVRVAEALAEAMGLRLQLSDERSQDRSIRVGQPVKSAYGGFEVRHGGSVEVKIGSLPAAVAIKIAEALKEAAND